MDRATARQSAGVFVVTLAAGLPFALHAGVLLAGRLDSTPPPAPAHTTGFGSDPQEAPSDPAVPVDPATDWYPPDDTAPVPPPGAPVHPPGRQLAPPPPAAPPEASQAATPAPTTPPPTPTPTNSADPTPEARQIAEG